MKFLGIIGIILLGILITGVVQYSFKYRTSIYPVIIVSSMFFLIGFLIKRAIHVKINFLFLYLICSFSFLFIQIYGLKINFVGLKYLSPALLILSVASFILGLHFLLIKIKYRIILASSLIILTVFIGYYLVPKLYYEENKHKLSKKINYDWKLKDVNGKIIDEGSLKNKVIFVNFWDSKCAYCFEKLPYIEELKSKVNNSNVIFLEVNPAIIDNYDDFKIAVKKDNTLNKSNTFFDEGSILSKTLNVNPLPHQFIIDKSGTVRYDYIGFPRDDKKFYVNDNYQYIYDLLYEK